MPLTPDELKQLWIQAGGNPQSAPLAAAIALAESAGNPNATHTNSSGSIDRGLWQINSIHGALSTLDPLANARAAVSISKNGATWEPWCTAYTDGACGKKGGIYDPFGAGASSAKFIGITGAAPGQGGGGAPGQVGDAVAGLGGLALGGIVDTIMSNLWLTLDVILNNVFYAGLAAIGIAAVVIGVIMLAKDSVIGAAVNQIKRVV
jgi:hypothetical protein